MSDEEDDFTSFGVAAAPLAAKSDAADEDDDFSFAAPRVVASTPLDGLGVDDEFR